MSSIPCHVCPWIPREWPLSCVLYFSPLRPLVTTKSIKCIHVASSFPWWLWSSDPMQRTKTSAGKFYYVLIPFLEGSCSLDQIWLVMMCILREPYLSVWASTVRDKRLMILCSYLTFQMPPCKWMQQWPTSAYLSRGISTWTATSCHCPVRILALLWCGSP